MQGQRPYTLFIPQHLFAKGIAHSLNSTRDSACILYQVCSDTCIECIEQHTKGIRITRSSNKIKATYIKRINILFEDAFQRDVRFDLVFTEYFVSQPTQSSDQSNELSEQVC